MSEKKTFMELLREIVAIQKSTYKEMISLHEDIKEVLYAIVETEISPQITVQTSTAEEIKESLKPILKRMIASGR